MSSPAPPSYAGYRFPAEIISYAVWLYYRFPFSLRHVDELLFARGIIVSHEIVRQWRLKFGQSFANQIRRRLPQGGDKWHLDEVAVKIAGVQHWLWRAVDQNGIVLDVLLQNRRNKDVTKRLLRKRRNCPEFGGCVRHQYDRRGHSGRGIVDGLGVTAGGNAG